MSKQKTGYLLLLPSIIIISALIVYPTFKTIYDSFFNIRIQTAALGAKFTGLDNYIKLLNDEHFWGTLKWTLEFTFVSVAIELVIGLALAMLMNRKIPGQGIIRTTILVPWAIPTIVSGVVWTQFFNQNGIINTILKNLGIINKSINWFGMEYTGKLTILLSDIWKTTPYMSLLLLAGLLTISPEYYEAAKIDGASIIQQFKHITLPLLKPTIMVTLLFRIVSAMRVYDLIIAMTGGGPAGTTETVSMYAVNTYFGYGNIGYGAALSVALLIISILISLIFANSLQTRLGD